MYCSRCGTKAQKEAKFCPSCGLDLSATTPMAALQDPSNRSETARIRNALHAEYEILAELGRGGMAIVFKARDRTLEREVAIKVLPSSLTFDGEFVQRFQREAKTSAKLEHPNIIPIYRVGETGEVIFFVMKFLRGQSLSEMLEQSGQMPPAEIRRILIETCRALGYAHKHDIVHRDIKPDNIMFDELGHAVVTDFGIAKAASSARLTGTGMSIGTPHYMSPEQARAQPLDGRSDVYSLGVVAYQCLTGTWPFDGEDSFAIGYKHIMDDLPIPQLKTGEGRSLFAIIQKMMSKAPEDRYQTAEDLIEALETKSSPARPSPAPPPAGRRTAPPAKLSGAPRRKTASPYTPTTPMPKAPSTFRPKRRAKKRRGVLLGMFLFLLVGGGGLSGYWYFVMDAEWPLPFANDALAALGLLPADTNATTTADSSVVNDALAIVVNDSAILADDSAQSDTSSTPADTTTVPPPAVVSPPPNFGTLVIRGLPAAARVTVDGQEVTGDTVRVDAGSVVVEAERLGYERFRQTVQVGRGETSVLIAAMTRLQADPPPVQPSPGGACAQSPPPPEYFTSGECFDTPATPMRAPVMTVPPNYQGELTPVVVLVRVSVDGQPIRTLRGARRQTASSALVREALRFAQDSLRYTPAQLNGQAIEAWARFPVQFRR